MQLVYARVVSQAEVIVPHSSIAECTINAVQTVLGKLGFKISKLPKHPNVDPADVAIYNSVKPFTMTSESRVYALIESVRYIVREQIPGAVVECGVWRGGSMMAAVGP